MNREETFLALLSPCESEIRNYVQMIVRDWNATEEIIQETLVTLWEKYSDVDDPESFRRLLFTVAKFRILAWRRDKAADRLLFDEVSIELLTDESIERRKETERRQELLETAITSLSDEKRKLLMASCVPDTLIREMAESQGVTPMSLYKKLQKIRAELFQRVTTLMKKE